MPKVTQLQSVAVRIRPNPGDLAPDPLFLGTLLQCLRHTCALLCQLCLAKCNSTDCSPPGSLSMGFSKQEYWSGLPFPSPGDLPSLQVTYQMYYLQMFSPILSVVFSLSCVLWSTKIFGFGGVQFIFSLGTCVLVSFLRNHCSIQGL